MQDQIRSLAVIALLVAAGCAAPANRPVSAPSADRADAQVRNIILLVADGAGPGLWSVAALASDQLAVKRMQVVGLVDTRSAVHKVTDSAAGASAYATGERVTNRTLSVGPASACPLPRSSDTVAVTWPAGCKPLESWFRIARDKGRATGLVTTAAVVDATPAAFAAHSPSRYWYDNTAEQFAAFGLDVLLGGGRRYFARETRNDRRDLLGEMCARSRCLASAAELAAYRPDDRPLVGLFTSADMDDLEQRPVGLPAMVEAALGKLKRNPRGFVAVFETEATDNATHSNLPLERVTADILEFDRAVAVALQFARRTPGTLVIATGDHETGGLTLNQEGEGVALAYTTRGHTAMLVPLFAAGPQAERFGGLRENYEIGRTLLDIVRRW
jgi:alkaline phosphatase